MKVLVWIALVVLTVVIEAELVAWSGPLQRALIRRAAAALPKPYSDRYREEWFRELEEVAGGPLTRLGWAVRLVLGRAAMARELGAPRTVVGFTGTLKRIGDILVATVALLWAAPLLVAIGFAIKLQDGGPVMFRQSGIGLDGTPFTFLKFRTVVMNPDSRLSLQVERVKAVPGGVVVKFVDPRITPIGRFLRQLSLDELPLLFNVLNGSMSLVGPRPRLRNEATHLPMDRVTVRPGLTGLWQLSGLDTDDATRLDREYVKHWSLWLDIKIMIKTFIAVCRNRAS
jgi:lipopolysaccharide/colanic/teichoic acid biosynthesis glycosyltransferase